MTSNRPIETPIGKPVRIGACGYQLYSESWPDGNTTFYAKIGQYYENRDTAEVYIIPKFRLKKSSDHRRAEDDAEKALEIAESSHAVLEKKKAAEAKPNYARETNAKPPLKLEVA